MKNLRDLLRDADPLNHERGWTTDARRLCYEAVIAAPPAAPRLPRAVFAAIAPLLLIATIVVGWHFWPGSAIDAQAAVRFEVRLAEDRQAIGLREAVNRQSATTIYLHQEVIVANGDIRQAQVVQGGAASTFNVTVTFSSDGAQRMLQATRGHLGRPVAILIGGEVVLAPVVRGPISTSATISGDYTKAEAERIAAGILGK